MMERGYKVDPRRTHQGIGQSLGVDILNPMLEIDIGPRRRGRRSDIGHLDIVEGHMRQVERLR